MVSGRKFPTFLAACLYAVVAIASPIPSLVGRPASVPEATWAKYLACVASFTPTGKKSSLYPESVDDCARVLYDDRAGHSLLYEYKA